MVWVWVFAFGTVAFFGGLVGWGLARVKDFVFRWRRRKIFVLDREERDLVDEWVLPDKEGRLKPDALEGGEVIPGGDANMTYGGEQRTYLVDRETSMCFPVPEPGGEEEAVPGLRPPDTAKTLAERAKGQDWENFRKSPADGLTALLQDNAGLIVAFMIVLLFVIAAMVTAMMFGAGGG